MSVFDILHHVALQLFAPTFLGENVASTSFLTLVHHPSEPNSCTLRVGTLRTSETRERGGGKTFYLHVVQKKT